MTKKLSLIVTIVLLTASLALAQYGSTATQSNPQSTTTTDTGKGKSKMTEGCIVEHDTVYYLQPIRGTDRNLVKLSSTEDLKPHVGHQVRVRGTESKISGAATQAPTSGATTGGTSGAAGESAKGTAQGQPGTAGAVAGQTTTGGTSGGMAAEATRQIAVERIDMISETCPAPTGGTPK